MNFSPRKRLFIALNLPLFIKKDLEKIILDLKNNYNNLIKWARPEGLHITLHFLGSLDQKIEESVKKILEKEVINFSPMNFKLGSLGAFPSVLKPRVIYIEALTLNNNLIKNLQKKLGDSLEKLVFNLDKRPWQAHITLGRVKKNLVFPPRGVKNTPIQKVATSGAEFIIESVELIASNRQKEDTVYNVVKSFKLVRARE